MYYLYIIYVTTNLNLTIQIRSKLYIMYCTILIYYVIPSMITNRHVKL